MNNLKKTLSTLCCAAALLIASSASAQQIDPNSECMVDADCANGWACDVVGASACPAPAPGEPDDGDISCGGEFKACVPPPPPSCEPSAQDPCADPDHVCVSYTIEECSGGGAPEPICEPGDPNCSDAPDGSSGGGSGSVDACTTSSESYCVPKYFAPCQTAADCGPGFTCEVEEICGCSGGGSVGRPDGSDGTDPAPGDDEGSCSCAPDPSGAKSCQLQQIACDDATPCPSGLECTSYEDLFPGGVPAQPDMVCTIDDQGNETCTSTEPDPDLVDESYCLPPSLKTYIQGYGGLPDGPSRGGVGSDGGSWSFEEAVAGGNGAVIDAQPHRPAAGGDGEFDDDVNGCSVASTGADLEGRGATGLLGLLTLGGLLGLRRRRRSGAARG